MTADSTTRKPTIVFMGTPDFAVPALQALHQTFGVAAVVTIPDKQRGRGLEVQASAVKKAAISLGITTILQPQRLRDPDFAATLSNLNPDVICVIAFRILPEEVYSLAKLGAFNVHASLLPKYRGAAPINHAIINGDTVSGVTSFLLTKVVDTGTILQQKVVSIPDGCTAGDLYEQLQPVAALCAVETTTMLLDGTASPTPQDDTMASLAPKVFRETSGINWHTSTQDVRNFIHGLSPTPCAWTLWNNHVMKVYRTAQAHNHSLEPGEWMIGGNEFRVGCADGTLVLCEIQLPGKKAMPAADVVRGYRGADRGFFSEEGR